MTGIVRAIVSKRHFGFIRSNGSDYFFHREDFNGFWEDLELDYTKDQIQVTFDIVVSNKGPRAANVKRTDFPNQAV
jgi:cold shock CspA family protein